MKKNLMIAVVAALIAMPALALDLHGARASGQVVETAEGYIKAAKPSAEVDALVAKVNAERKAEYARIAQQKGQTVEVVGKITAEQIAKSVAAGN